MIHNKEIFFIPLGGGQRVGGSCYLLRLGDVNILLDAGIGIQNKVVFFPDEYVLTTSPFIQSMGQIHQIYISHAHMDHIGYLLPLMQECRNANIFMTHETAAFAEYQLYDKRFLLGNCKKESMRLAARNLLDQATKVSFMQKRNFGSFQVSFYPAGHIPGAMMILFEFAGKKILYTGDFSVNDTALTRGCILPDGLDVDVMILCALHAKHPWYRKSCNQLDRSVQKVLTAAKQYQVWCCLPQLSKGVEFLKRLNQKNTEKIPVYLDSSILQMVKKMEQLKVPVLAPENKIAGQISGNSKGIYLTADAKQPPKNGFEQISVDFSLHEGFSEMEQLISKINPRQVIAVHCAEKQNLQDETIEQIVMRNPSCRTQFVFAEDGCIYKL